MLQVTHLRCEYRENPCGLDVKKPRFSWRLISDGAGIIQSSYRIEVWSGDTVLWDTGAVQSRQSIQVEYDGSPLQPCTLYRWRVSITDNHGDCAYGDARFETGLFAQFSADFITHTIPEEVLGEKCPILRRDFTLSGKVISARAYVSALGLYELYLNGEKAGNLYLTPGWTSYEKRLQYQTYDVTNLLRSGGNGIGLLLGNGWYKGNLAWNGRRNFYGDRQAAILELHITYSCGKTEVLSTDGEWRASTGGVLMSELYHGETYDARLEPEGWSNYGFNDSSWFKTEEYPHDKSILTAQENEGTVRCEELPPAAVLHTPNGQTVLDFGQNLTGFVEVTMKLPEAKSVRLRHGEVLDRDGNVYLENLRTAKQATEYISDGKKHTYRPHFSFQGFRYCIVDGLGEMLDVNSFKAVVLHTKLEQTGSFECSHPIVNQLVHNIRWGQKGNFVDVPTDCPQRDERLGWTGDAQIFCRTACYQTDAALFYTKWLRDLACDQEDDGRVPDVVPDILHSGGACGWGDAAVIVPWTLYQVYGDVRVLEEQFDSMRKWIDYIKNQGVPYLWNTGHHYGDWLSLDNGDGVHVGATPTDFLATAFYAYSTLLTSKAAAVLGRVDDERELSSLYHNIVAAFRREFVTSTGRLCATTQTANVIALMFDLLEPRHRPRAVEALKNGVAMRGGHLDTGFLGTPYLCHVLSEFGLHDIACELFLKEDYPSWLYPVKKGATTIWERWDGIKADGSFQKVAMNSFNHYAYGSIGEWLYRKVAGIDIAEPGCGRLLIKPYFCKGMSWAKATVDTMYGPVSTEWEIKDRHVRLTFTIPPNAEADIVLTSVSQTRESSGLRFSDSENGGVNLKAGSGTYTIEYTQS